MRCKTKVFQNLLEKVNPISVLKACNMRVEPAIELTQVARKSVAKNGNFNKKKEGKDRHITQLGSDMFLVEVEM